MANTLGDLKATVADDLARSDLTTQIAAAITNAISHYKDQHFYFSETRASTFTTTAAQSRYTSADDADIPLYLDFEAAFIVDSNSEAYELSWMEPAEMEYLLDASAASGRPHSYTYFEQSVWLFPVPDATYTFRPIATVKVAAPAADATTGNAWMADAPYELLRCRAKLDLAMHVLNDDMLATKMALAEKDALARIRRETAKKAHGGTIQAPAF